MPHVRTEHVFFSGKIKSLATVIAENERPLQGLAGILDWKLQGQITRFLERGFIQGKTGECVLMPISTPTGPLNLFLIGCGSIKDAGERSGVPLESIVPLRENLKKLKLDRIGVSISDFGGIPPEKLDRILKGVTLWVGN